ncbi:TPA_asm: UL34.5 sORF 2 [Human alphaherpesvirus 1]|uniref:Uncharacterized protein n=1 Tax=Human herpesvirus 1 TaxID=10298 RepID=A0A2Z4H836_HHV1|nr:hypothetical protein [Human alphaherpesvirus 1]DAC85586.1 TPA_asm: UL34.5 sORF 2 [Human alphaherpesvirus 1]
MNRNASCTRGMRTKQLIHMLAIIGRASRPSRPLMVSRSPRDSPVVSVEPRITLVRSGVIAPPGALCGR